MRPRRAVAAVAAAVAGVVSPLATAPASALITSSYFDCGSSRVSVLTPGYTFQGVGHDATVWWVPQYYRYDGTSWVQYASGEYHYNRQGGAPHAWQRYPNGEQEGNGQVLTAPGGYYAVLNWVYAGGQWESAWAQNADQVSGPKPEDLYWCLA